MSLLSLAFSWSISLSSCFRSLYSPPLPPSSALSFCALFSACLSSLSSYLSTYLYLCVLSHCAGVHGVFVCACWFVTTIAPFIARGLMLDVFWLGLGCANAVKLKGIACSNSLSSKNNLIVMTSTAGAARFVFCFCAHRQLRRLCLLDSQISFSGFDLYLLVFIGQANPPTLLCSPKTRFRRCSSVRYKCRRRRWSLSPEWTMTWLFPFIASIMFCRRLAK